MEKIKVERKGNVLIIGDAPQLIVDLINQNNYIKIQDKTIPYHREVSFSEDLFSGKRDAVFESAVKYYYRQACNVAEGMRIAEQYYSKMNTLVREVK